MISFVINDPAAVAEFLSQLPRKIYDARFATDMYTGERAPWKPHHTVLAIHNGVAVALADCIIGSNQIAANASIVAQQGSGGCALHALFHLKRTLPKVEQWESTLNAPTRATIAISRRFFDCTYDQLAWDISQDAIKYFGGLAPWALAAPLFMSASACRGIGVPLPDKLDPASRGQVLRCVRDQDHVLIGPSGVELDRQDYLALAFDILQLRMQRRQHVTRLLLLMAMAATKGKAPPKNALNRIANPTALQEFNRGVQEGAEQLAKLPGGCFKVVA